MFRLWKERSIKLFTKVTVHKAVVLSTLLHGAESWTTYRRPIPYSSQVTLDSGVDASHSYFGGLNPNAEEYLGPDCELVW